MIDILEHKKKKEMEQILEVRYTDLESERNLSEKLYKWATENNDLYAKAFAGAYLGDYYLAIYDEENAGKYLLKAQTDLARQDWGHIKLRIYSLLGVYYDMRSDEQNATEYYLKAISAAQKVKDIVSECVVLNNLAFNFERCSCYEESYGFYKEAYRLQEIAGGCHFLSTILGNLAEISLALNRPEEAKKYIIECEKTEKDPILNKILSYKSWCSYYLSTGKINKAVGFAKLYLENKEIVNENKLTAFDNYRCLCTKFQKVKNEEYTRFFLEEMEKICAGSGLDRMKMLEDARIQYITTFLPPEKHPAAYRRFHEKKNEFHSLVAKTISDAMRSKIYLAELIEQSEEMQSVQKNLEKEVNMDELTKIYNRKYFEMKMRDFTGGLTAKSVGIIVLDVDYFKEYNDYYGHMRGDVVLKEIAQCFMDNGNKYIYPCRYGGDEFVCLCYDMAEDEIINYIEKIQSSLKGKEIFHGKSHCSQLVTLSIGYAVSDKKTQTEVHLLFQLADGALYKSKGSGRNTYTGSKINEI